jgi:hypothetical protein
MNTKFCHLHVICNKIGFSIGIIVNFVYFLDLVIEPKQRVDPARNPIEFVNYMFNDPPKTPTYTDVSPEQITPIPSTSASNPPPRVVFTLTTDTATCPKQASNEIMFYNLYR